MATQQEIDEALAKVISGPTCRGPAGNLMPHTLGDWVADCVICREHNLASRREKQESLRHPALTQTITIPLEVTITVTVNERRSK